MRKVLSIALALGLVSVACNSASGDSSTSVGGGSSTSGAAATSTTSGDTTATSEETTTTAPASGGGADCLVGTWELDSGAFVAMLAAVFAGEGSPGEVSSIGGSYVVEINADGTMTATRADWGFTVETSEGNMTMRMNGMETGTWSADDATMTVSLDGSDVTFDASFEVNGQVIEMDSSQFPFEVPETISSDATYSCEGDTLTVTTDGVSSVLNRA